MSEGQFVIVSFRKVISFFFSYFVQANPAGRLETGRGVDRKVCMDKKDPTYIPKKTVSRKKTREDPPTTRSVKQSERFEEEGLEILSDSESVTLVQQKVLGERLQKAN